MTETSPWSFFQTVIPGSCGLHDIEGRGTEKPRKMKFFMSIVYMHISKGKGA